MPREIPVDPSQQSAYQRIWDELCRTRGTSGAGTTPRPPQWQKNTRGKKKCFVCGKPIPIAVDYIGIVEWSGKLLGAFCSETCLHRLLNAGGVYALRTAQAADKVAAGREAKEKAKAAAKTSRPPAAGYCATCGCMSQFADGRQYQCRKCKDIDGEPLGGEGSTRFCRKCGKRFTVEMVQQRICPSCR